jgi:hypothetical protein
MKPLNVRLVAVCDDGGDTHAMRSALEAFGATVDYRSCWTPAQVIEALDADGCECCRPDHILLCGHGGEDAQGRAGILVDKLGPEVFADGQQPFVEALTDERIRSLVHLTGQTVVSTACSSGVLADAFLAAGASHVVAPIADEAGAAAVFFVVSYFFHLLELKFSVDAAVRRAAATDDETGLFRLTR